MVKTLRVIRMKLNQLVSYLESDIYRRQNNKHFAELAPQNGGKQLT